MPAPKSRDNSEFSDCAKPHVAVKPRKGDAVLFHSIRPTGEIERRSMHGACPVVKVRLCVVCAEKLAGTGHVDSGCSGLAVSCIRNPGDARRGLIIKCRLGDMFEGTQAQGAVTGNASQLI